MPAAQDILQAAGLVENGFGRGEAESRIGGGDGGAQAGAHHEDLSLYEERGRLFAMSGRARGGQRE